MADTGPAWTTIESDPGVFTELMEAMGAPGVQMEELYSLDAGSLKALEPVHGLVFLFRWTPEAGADERPTVAHPEETPQGLFFAKQVAQNACATQAILSVLLNRPDKIELTAGGPAATLREFCVGLPPDIAGLSLASCDPVREAHNSFAPPTPIVPDEKKPPSPDDDAFHFVAYVPFAGALWELDGLRKGPIKLCDLESGGNGKNDDDGDWLDRVAPFLHERVARHSATEVRFNLMAVVGSRIKAAEERVAKAEEAVASYSSSGGGDAAAAAVAANEELAAAKAALAAERAKRARWAAENERRKHNLLPFVFELLRSLAERGKLAPLIEEAKKPSARRRTGAPGVGEGGEGGGEEQKGG